MRKETNKKTPGEGFPLLAFETKFTFPALVEAFFLGFAKTHKPLGKGLTETFGAVLSYCTRNYIYNRKEVLA